MIRDWRRWWYVRARVVGGVWLDSGLLTHEQAELFADALRATGMQAQLRELTYPAKRAAA